MKFLNPPLQVVAFRNARRAEMSVWNSVEVLLFVVFVWKDIWPGTFVLTSKYFFVRLRLTLQ